MLRDWSKVKKALHDGFAATDSYMLEAIAEIEQLRQEKAELQSQVDALSDTVNMYVTPYYELKAEKAELVEVLKHSLEIVQTLECECDSYHGFTCGKHDWERKLEQAIAKLGGGEPR